MAAILPSDSHPHWIKGEALAWLERIARATAGRVHYTVESELAGRPGAIHFIAGHLVG